MHADQTAVDFLAIETIPCSREVSAILKLLPTRPGVKAMLSMVCNSGSTLSSGEKIADVVKMIEERDELGQIEAIGVNCTAPEYVSELIKNIRLNTNRLIAVYPNSGEKWESVKKIWLEGEGEYFNPGPTLMAEFSLEWRRVGANIIGGCCKITPDHIRKLRETHDAINPSTFEVLSIEEL